MGALNETHETIEITLGQMRRAHRVLEMLANEISYHEMAFSEDDLKIWQEVADAVEYPVEALRNVRTGDVEFRPRPLCDAPEQDRSHPEIAADAAARYRCTRVRHHRGDHDYSLEVSRSWTETV